ILLVIFLIYGHAGVSNKAKEKTFLLKSGEERKLLEVGKARETEVSENVEREKTAEIPILSKNKKRPRKNIEKAFQKITLQQLDEAERTADGTTAQYWESDLIFFGRAGDFTLYGMNEDRVSRGLIVRRDESLFFTDEYYFAPGLYYPKLFAEDFDRDGEKEAAIILHRLTGTGYSVDELFLLDETEQEHTADWKLYQYPEKDYLEQLEKILNFEILTDEYQVHFFTADKSQDFFIDMSDELIGDDYEIIVSEDRICVGDIVAFRAEGSTLKISFTIGLHCEEYATPLYSVLLPLAEAEISYQNGDFELHTLKFVEDKF
ncbi:MAG: hypothetical protein K2K54_12100, partial [Lachnospiraceae bacterium]|nr:hypothetical protein [Lachnospiraceae bacterium]